MADQNHWWIVAGADESHRKINPFGHACLFARKATPDSQNFDVYTVIDWEALVILPKHIAFKGDNGNYLSAQSMDGHPYLQFSATDPTDPKVENEVFIAGDQSVRIKSTHTQNFRRRNTSPDNSINNWISADSNDTANKNSDKHQRRQCRCSSSQPGQQQFLQEVD
ncbi:unnamed protein product [Prunus armeniaca]|uniref:Agglutinin domain-containing protein n=1 Tax=Prunus armeniaca TaxID=36596 RepID=A0A6J5XH54_PRUAR|nr:unnamed protein product [Prunus armeniaca]